MCIRDRAQDCARDVSHARARGEEVPGESFCCESRFPAPLCFPSFLLGVGFVLALASPHSPSSLLLLLLSSFPVVKATSRPPNANPPQALEALKDGIVDSVGGLDQALSFVEENALVKKTDKGVYGLLKREMFKEAVALLETSGRGDDGGSLGAGLREAQEKDRREMKRRLEASEAKAKL